MNVRMLKEVGRNRPVSSPAQKPHHLLATTNIVYDCSSRSSCEGSVCTRSELSNFPCDGRIGDGRRIVPNALSAHTGSTKTTLVSKLHTTEACCHTYLVRPAVGNPVLLLILTSCSTPVLQHPAPAIAVVVPCLVRTGAQFKFMARIPRTKFSSRVDIQPDHSDSK